MKQPSFIANNCRDRKSNSHPLDWNVMLEYNVDAQAAAISQLRAAQAISEQEKHRTRSQHILRKRLWRLG